ncbi:MAG: DUF433 domain-containing protein [Chloroflexi bacterium]|nr:DUF433 domain-containing protein [Chloroflexota bacterium]
MPEFAGIYELAEVVRYLQATSCAPSPSYEQVRRWVRSGLPMPDLVVTRGRNLVVVFEDLISLRLVVALRQAGFSLQHIRSVHDWLQDATNCQRPFAIQELWVSSSDIFVQMEKQLLSASKRGQYAMGLVKGWLRTLGRPDLPTDMTFKQANGCALAASWKPQPHVVLDPLVQFGAPCLEGTRIPTRAVWSMVRAGDSPRAVARDYGVSLVEVEAAIEWEKRLAA